MKKETLIGVTHVWAKNVRITGYSALENKSIPPGTIGDMEIIETGTDGCVINARFHPHEGGGYGLVTRPAWEFLPDPANADASERVTITRLRAEVVRSHRDLVERHALAAHAPVVPCRCKDCEAST